MVLEVAPQLWCIDTMLGGVTGVTAAYLVGGDAPTLIDVGARTSAETVASALDAHGVGPGDLATILLTHVHLDHCGATGDLAARFPSARILVHPRGAPHLAEPDRLIAASRAVYDTRAELFGGLAPTAPERIGSVEDGVALSAGPGRTLRIVHAPGHARHHLAVLDEATGVLIAADALGVRVGGADLHPAVPPPDYDPDAFAETIDRLAALGAETCLISHFADVGPVDEALDAARAANARIAAACRALPEDARGDPEAVGAALEGACPVAQAVRTPEALARWILTGFADNNLPGVLAWLSREARSLASEGARD